MDRDRIERRDFPTSRRGYDTAAVDAHLRELADAFEARTPPPAQPLSSATSEQVRHILEAAERSVAELRARAHEDASAHVARVQSAADGLLGKLDALEAELGTLLGALRTSGERLQAGLAELQAEVGRGEQVPAPPVVEDLAAFEEDFAAEAPADEAGARLIALNMALDGKPREETARYLAEHFALADAEGLLDDVYARAGR